MPNLQVFLNIFLRKTFASLNAENSHLISKKHKSAKKIQEKLLKTQKIIVMILFNYSLIYHQS